MTDDADAAIVEALQEAYYAEIESAMNYLSNGLALEGVRGEELGTHLTADFQEEMAHAQEIAEHLDYAYDVVVIDAFGFTPTQSYLECDGQYKSTGAEFVPVLEAVVQAEEEAIQMYRNLAALADDANRYETRALAERLLDDELHHRDEFESFLQEYRS